MGSSKTDITLKNLSVSAYENLNKEKHKGKDHDDNSDL